MRVHSLLWAQVILRRKTIESFTIVFNSFNPDGLIVSPVPYVHRFLAPYFPGTSFFSHSGNVVTFLHNFDATQHPPPIVEKVRSQRFLVFVSSVWQLFLWENSPPIMIVSSPDFKSSPPILIRECSDETIPGFGSVPSSPTPIIFDTNLFQSNPVRFQIMCHSNSKSPTIRATIGLNGYPSHTTIRSTCESRNFSVRRQLS
jgi:hypothetical protein